MNRITLVIQSSMFMRHVEMFDLCQIFQWINPFSSQNWIIWLHIRVSHWESETPRSAHWLTDLNFSLFMTQSYCMTWEGCSTQVAWTSYIFGYFIGVLNHFWSLKFWNDMNVNKRWTDLHFWMKLPFKIALVSLFLSGSLAIVHTHGR